mgnify:CR=1 FL=1
MAKKDYKRTQYLVNKPLQLAYSGQLVLHATLITLIFGLALWYLNREYLELFYRIVGEDALPKAYIQSIENSFLVKIIVAAVAMAVLLLFVGIYTSHRIAGPLFRLTKFINLVGLENELQTVQIRKKDQLKEMASAFNHMVHSLRDKMYQDLRLIDQVKDRIGVVMVDLKKDSVNIKELTERLKEIDELTSDLKAKKINNK